MRKTMITFSELKHLVDIGFIKEDKWKYFVLSEQRCLYKGLMASVFCGTTRKRLHVRMDESGLFYLVNKKHSFSVPNFVLSRNYKTICRAFKRK